MYYDVNINHEEEDSNKKINKKYRGFLKDPHLMYMSYVIKGTEDSCKAALLSISPPWDSHL